MKRASSLAALLALGVVACTDNELTAPDREWHPAFDQVASGPVVNSLDDVVDTNGCADTHCSLREAIAFAASGATITFGGVSGTITLGGTELLIDKDLTITGPGAASLTVSGNRVSRVIEIGAAATVTISGLTIRYGRAISGGGLLNAGTALLSRVLVTGNSATGNATLSIMGAGIFNSGNLTLENSAVSANSGYSFGSPPMSLGAGIFNKSGTLTLIGSTVGDNYAHANSARGGGIFSYGDLVLTNSTVADNSVDAISGEARGGGIYLQSFESAARLSLTNSTVSGNDAGSQMGVVQGGGIFLGDAVAGATITNALVAGNSIRSSDAIWVENDLRAGALITAAHSLIGSVLGHSITDEVAGNIVGVPATDLKLGVLADNGGPTQTMALLDGSPAIDAGTAAGCPATDQRGVLRPQGAGCDIGAFEARAYAFTGFEGPVANSPLLNEMKAGQAVPVKFSLNGEQGASVLASGYPQSVQFECDLSSGTSLVDETVTAGASGLSFDPLTDTYTYVWKTNKSWAGTCRRLTLQFADEAGTTRTAEFRFIK